MQPAQSQAVTRPAGCRYVRPAPPRRNPARGSSASPGPSGAEAVDPPGAVRAGGVAQPVVEPVLPALPELDRLRGDPEAAPVRRHRHLFALGVARRQLGVGRVQFGARGDHRGLGAGPGAQLGAVRAAAEVRGGLVAPGAPDRAGDDDLPGQRMPGEEQRGARVRRQIAALAGVVVGVEDEALGVELLHQDRARAGAPLGVRGGDDHGVGLVERAVQRRPGRVLEPACELVHGVGGEVLFGESFGPVLLAHRGGIEDGIQEWFAVGHAVILPYLPTVALSVVKSPQAWHAGLSCWFRAAPDPSRGAADVRVRTRARRSRSVRDGDRRTGQGGRRPALPGRRHRGPGRSRLLRQRVGAAGRRRLQPRPAARRAVPHPGALRRHPRGRPVGAGHARARVGTEAAARHRRGAGPRGPGAGRGDGAVLRRPVRARPGAGDGAAAGDRQGEDGRGAVHDPLAGRAGPAARRRGRRVLDLRRGARHERVHLHRPCDRLHRRGRRRRAVRRRRRHVRPAARRRTVPGAGDDRGDRAHRGRGGLRQADPGPGRAADGLRAPGVPGRGPAGAGAAAHGAGAGGAAVRGGGGAGEGRAGGAAQPPARPGAGHERGVLGGDHAGLRRGPGAHVHLDVHLCPYGGVVGAHPGAEADRPPGAAFGAVRGPGGAPPAGHRRVRGHRPLSGTARGADRWWPPAPLR
ncbi:hypothetical protein SGPA1_50740 [Streptomyces misionensis JCM 4497]